jgi:hypothetical protein
MGGAKKLNGVGEKEIDEMSDFLGVKINCTKKVSTQSD